MSASNWAVCPQCKVDAGSKADALEATSKAAYGTTSAEEYEKLTAEARAYRAALVMPEETLREDYSQGVDEDGEYSVSYGCLCSVCGFGYRYEYKESIKLEAANAM